MKAAEAIKETIEQRFPDSCCLVVDTLRYINPVVDRLVIGSYLKAIRNTPLIYATIYRMSETGENIYDFSRAVNKILSLRLKNLINEFKPSIIICTHPFPLQMMSILKKKNKTCIPVMAVITDYVPHSLWFHGNIDAYVVAHDFIKYKMINMGIPEKIIFPYGIPVSQRFLQRKNKEAILNEFNLGNKLTILIMGGSLGFGALRYIFQSLLNCRKDLQIIVLAGKNFKLRTQLENYSSNSSKKVIILGYTDRVSDFMDISDFIITKPGGMTVAEALVKELPICIISPIPGQEEGNAHFLLNNGAAVEILPGDYMDGILDQVVDNPFRIRQMKESLIYLARPNASSDIVNLMEKLMADITGS